MTFVKFAGAFQVLLILLLGVATEYGTETTIDTAGGGKISAIEHYYPMYQDVHTMIFIGFGFLMTFLKKYGFGSVGFNFLVSALIIQWSLITNGCIHNWLSGHGGVIKLDIQNLIAADFACGAVLISFGAVLGKISPTQLLVMGIFEMIWYGINEYIGVAKFKAVDMGGSMFVHTFGAYFGIACSRAMYDCRGKEDHKDNGSSKNSDTFAMIGAIFLWMFWPSFNGALATEGQQYRVVINTVISLSACCVSAFLFSAYFRHEHKFDMVDIQNATLAGGVAVGSSADLVIEPWGAALIGLIAGGLSVYGYTNVQPYLAEKFGLDDTCGVHNLHGMPGIMGGIGGAVSAALASATVYGKDISTVFAARAGGARSAGDQGGYQFAALCVTLAMSSVGGFITGKILTCMNAPSRNQWYDDALYWEVPEEESEESEEIESEAVKEDLEAGNGKEGNEETNTDADANADEADKKEDNDGAAAAAVSSDGVELTENHQTGDA
jgi:ammonium transporter Rh